MAASLEDRVAALEAFVASLKAAVGGGTRVGSRAASAGPPGVVREETAFPDSMLAKDWANKNVTKDCEGWAGGSQIGRTFADAPSSWHIAMARSYEKDADTGRRQDPVRKQNNGKPWHEADTFNAKLHKAWAARNEGKTFTARQQPLTPPAGDDFGGSARGNDDFGYGASAVTDDSEIPFIRNATFGRWDRP